ncbi:MAG: ATP-binding protein [Actinomycetota bacterium]
MAATRSSFDEAALVPVDRSLEIGALRGVVAYRWLTLGWAAIAVFFQRNHLSEAPVAVGALTVAGAFTAWTTLAARNDAGWLMRAPAVVVEVVIGAGLLLVDGVVWGALEETRRQSLPWAWPHAAIFTAALVFGLRPALAIAAVMAGCSWWGELNVRGGSDSWVGVGSKSALYFLAAIGVALVMARLREASSRISAARAREEMARTLHDGVLQTLAVVQRRSDDTELVDLARRQDQDLRAYLWGADDAGDLVESVTHAARRARDGYGVAVSMLLPDDLPRLDDAARDALAGAVGEAITNAAKHADASRITVFGEPVEDDPDGHTVYVSVNDDGRGFDPDGPVGDGIDRSIRTRLAEIDGRVEITSSPDTGTEVQFWAGGTTARER